MNAADRFFIDTNVLLYSIDDTNVEKRSAARKWVDALWAAGAGRLSWQVLHEFYVNATRKFSTPRDKAREIATTFAAWRPVDTTLGLIERAWYWTDQADVSYWDALIVAAAERADCVWLISEDFQAGRAFDTVRVVNPFKAGLAEFGLEVVRH